MLKKVLRIEPGSNRRNPKKIRVVYEETELGDERVVTFSRNKFWDKNPVYLLFRFLLTCNRSKK